MSGRRNKINRKESIQRLEQLVTYLVNSLQGIEITLETVRRGSEDMTGYISELEEINEALRNELKSVLTGNIHNERIKAMVENELD